MYNRKYKSLDLLPTPEPLQHQAGSREEEGAKEKEGKRKEWAEEENDIWHGQGEKGEYGGRKMSEG